MKTLKCLYVPAEVCTFFNLSLSQSQWRNAYLWLAQCLVNMIQLIVRLLCLSAAAGDRPAAGRAANGEDAAAPTHTEAAGSTAGDEEDGEQQTQRQAKGTVWQNESQVFVFNWFLMHVQYDTLVMFLCHDCTVKLCGTTWISFLETMKTYSVDLTFK